MIITLKEHPALAKLVRPFSKKHKAIVYRQDAVALDGTFWDGGSRSDYHLVEIATGNIEALPRSDPPQFGGVQAVVTKSIPSGFVVIRSGVFCGKPSTPSIYIRNDENIA